MATSPERTHLWWDKELDRAGRPIRQDVRAAAHEVWKSLRQKTKTTLGDASDAAEILESVVEQISRYLDCKQCLPFSVNAVALLTVAFRRHLQKRAAKLARLETVGGISELAELLSDADSFDQIARKSDLEKIALRLSPRNLRILILRWKGYDWKYIANELEIAVSTAQHQFWRNIRQAQLEMLTESTNSGTPER